MSLPQTALIESVTNRIRRLRDEGPVFIAQLAMKHGNHPATWTRWMLKGVIGPDGQKVYLEHYRQGQKLVTSWPAVDRFLVALQRSDSTDPPPAPRSPTQRDRAAERADRELAEAGW